MEDAQALAKSYSNTISEQLKASGLTTTVDEVVENIKNLTHKNGEAKYPNSIFNSEDVVADITKALGAKNAKLAERFGSGPITLEDANKIRSAIGDSIFKKGVDSHTVKLTQEDMSIIQESLRNIIGDRVPSTEPFFKKLTASTNAIKSLKRLTTLKHSGLVHQSDLLGVGIGALTAGAPGAVAGEVINRLQSTPQARLAGAKLLNKIAPTMKKASTLARPTAYAAEASQTQ